MKELPNVFPYYKVYFKLVPRDKEYLGYTIFPYYKVYFKPVKVTVPVGYEMLFPYYKVYFKQTPLLCFNRSLSYFHTIKSILNSCKFCIRNCGYSISIL